MFGNFFIRYAHLHLLLCMFSGASSTPRLHNKAEVCNVSDVRPEYGNLSKIGTLQLSQLLVELHLWPLLVSLSAPPLSSQASSHYTMIQMESHHNVLFAVPKVPC